MTAHAYVLKDNLTRADFDWDTIYGAETVHRVLSDIPELGFWRLAEGAPVNRPLSRSCRWWRSSTGRLLASWFRAAQQLARCGEPEPTQHACAAL